MMKKEMANRTIPFEIERTVGQKLIHFDEKTE